MEFNEAFQPAGGTTGRSLVLFEEGGAEAGMQAVQEAVGVQVVAASGEEAAPAEGGGILFESLGVAVVDAPPDQVMQAAGSAAILAVEPERIVYALEIGRRTRQATNGHALLPPPPPAPRRCPSRVCRTRRAQRRVPARLPRGGAAPDRRPSRAPQRRRGARADDRRRRRVPGDLGPAGDQGRQLLPHAARASASRCSTPASTSQHPDFAGRSVTTQSFIDRRGGPGRPRSRDALHRHRARARSAPACSRATASPTRPRSSPARCSRTPARARTPGSWPGSSGRSQNGCAVVSMSLGAPTQPGQPFSQVFERVAQRAQEQGTLIIAAAGNESQPPGAHQPGRPSGELPVDHGRRRDGRAAARSRASPTAGSTPTAGRSTSPAPAWTCTRAGRCRRATAASAARAWRRRTSRGSRRSTPRRTRRRAARRWGAR